MRDSEKAFYLFFDWIEDIDSLDGADAWKVVKAIAEYHQHGTNPLDNVDGPLKAVVSIMFHQIKRKEAVSAQRAENARSTNEKKKAKAEFLRTQSERTTNAEQSQCNATEYSIQNTDNSIHSITHSDACVCTHTREEKEDELMPPELRKGLEEQLKEQARQKYLNGPLGKGVVLLSGEQLDSLLDELSLDEFNKYVEIVADCELNGKKYKNKTHYRAILDMAAADRKTGGITNGK